MATCAEIIKVAFRRSGIAAANVSLNASQQKNGLERLQGLYDEMVGSGLFGQFNDYYLASGNYTAKERDRIYKFSDASVVTIPATVTDPCTNKVRAPLDGACIIVIDPNQTETPPDDTETDEGFKTTVNLYDALKGWSVINDLAPTSFAPLSGRNEDGLKSLLAVALCDEFGYTVPPKLARDAAMAKLRIGSKNDQPRKRATPDYF